MKKTSQLINGQSPSYRDFPFRLLLSLFAAHFILSHTTAYGFFEVILVNGYLFSLISSFIIALALIQMVYWVTTLLDKSFPYTENWRLRCVLQIFIGIVGVALLAFMFAYGFFFINNVTDRTSRYIDHDFPIIVAFIIGINAYYFIRYAIYVNNKLFNRVRTLAKRDRKQAVKNVTPMEITSNNEDEVKIACIVKIERKYMVMYTNITEFPWFKPIKSSFEDLPKSDYFVINPRCIIAKEIILSVTPIKSKRYALTLKPPFHNKLNEEDLIVSQSNKIDFEHWYVK